MAGKSGSQSHEESERRIKPSSTIFFLNNDLVRVITSNRGANIIYLFNITIGKQQSMLLSDFKKHRKRAYLIVDVARLLNTTSQAIHRYIWSGLIDPPTGASIGGKREFHKRSYFSEDDVFKIREAMTTIHRGRPRKDGIVINRGVLTEQELRAKMGDALVLYTRTDDGRYIPIWQETIY